MAENMGRPASMTLAAMKNTTPFRATINRRTNQQETEERRTMWKNTRKCANAQKRGHLEF
jgi:hypothetical protein